MKTAVIGPGGQPYLTDGHHTLTSFWEAPGAGPDTAVRLRITANLKDAAPEAFWAEMQSQGWTWLKDADGKTITPDQLPASLGLESFANDQYRGALFFVRDVGYGQPLRASCSGGGPRQRTMASGFARSRRSSITTVFWSGSFAPTSRGPNAGRATPVNR